MKRWNKADIVLCLAALLFAFCLALRINYPELWGVRAAFFIAEAMLVGGIADWFAVTALFTKPLGFPYHTALLPRQREKFIDACARMVQDDFFSKKRLLAQIKQMNLSVRLLNYLKSPQGTNDAVGFLLKTAEEIMEKADKKAIAATLEEKCFSLFLRLENDAFQRFFSEGNTDGVTAEVLFDRFLYKARSEMAKAQKQEEIEHFLRLFMAEKSSGILGSLLFLLAETANVINFADAAEAIQRRLCDLCEEMRARDHVIRRLLLARIKMKVAELAGEREWKECKASFSEDLRGSFLLREEIEKGLHTAFSLLKRPENTKEERAVALMSPLAVIIFKQLHIFISEMEADRQLREKIDVFIGEALCRGALEARSMIGVVVEEALRGLSDEELNKLVYDKVEQDMVWLRMNGSIVGGVIGAALFCLMELFG